MSEERKKRTITLSDRPPITIIEEDWPVIAQASDKEFDNQYEFQANRISKWWIGVRQHEDGRTIVYATYSYSSNWQDARNYSARHGVMQDAEHVVAAIRTVVRRMAECEHNGEDASRWPTLADECIADLPAEEIV